MKRADLGGGAKQQRLVARQGQLRLHGTHAQTGLPSSPEIFALMQKDALGVAIHPRPQHANPTKHKSQLLCRTGDDEVDVLNSYSLFCVCMYTPAKPAGYTTGDGISLSPALGSLWSFPTGNGDGEPCVQHCSCPAWKHVNLSAAAI